MVSTQLPSTARSPGAMITRLRLRWALAIAVAGGAMLGFAFPPYGAWPLAVLGPAVLAITLAGRGWRASFAIGAVFGLAFFLTLLSWVINVAWYAWVALVIAESLIFAVLVLGQRLLLALPGWPLALAGWWVLVEGVRSRWPWGFPWGRLAMSQADSPAKGWAAIGGAPLLTFLVALAGATLAWLALAAMENRGRPRAVAAPAIALAVVAGVAVAGTALPVDPVGNGTRVVVAAIQGDVPHARSLTALLNNSVVTANHADATVRLASQVASGKRQAPDLVIWPENATNVDPRSDPSVYAEISGAVDAIKRPVLVGAVLDYPRRNVGQLWLPGRGPAADYVKRRLVPFGEYIPFRGLLSKITSLTQLQPIDFTAGTKNTIFGVGKIRLGDVICYEIGFDDLVRSDVTDGANLLTMQTNDATFERDGQPGETEQQLAMARIRAVESDRAVIVASTTGVSAIIAPDGSLIASSGTWRPAILESSVPLITHRTWADNAGAWPEYAIIIATVLAMAVAAARLRTKSRTTGEGPSASDISALLPTAGMARLN